VYARTVGGEELSFGVSGMLWRDNLVMYDRQTDSWWAQGSGQAIRGPKRGAQLEQVASDMMTWKEWRTLHPNTRVLAPPRGRGGTGRDAYASYHRSRSIGVTGRTRSAGALDAKAQVLGFRLGRGAFAVALDALAGDPVLQADAGGTPVVVVASPDGSSARAFEAGRHTFRNVRAEAEGVMMTDENTGSQWDAFAGRAVSGPLAGQQLDPIVAHLSYWFSWHSFFPDSTLLKPAGGRQ
jgi:hypothetical protein